VSAKSPQRSSPRGSDRELELAWAPTPRQDLVDALAEAELDHRRAETRALEAKTAREERREDAEIVLLETQTGKIAGEIAQQPLEEEESRARIKETKARTEESEARTLRIWLLNLLPPLFVATGIIIGSVDSGSLASSGYELLRGKTWLLPRLTGGS
jgi:hypothetical protein